MCRHFAPLGRVRRPLRDYYFLLLVPTPEFFLKGFTCPVTVEWLLLCDLCTNVLPVVLLCTVLQYHTFVRVLRRDLSYC